jgi:hypothetical protein
MSKKKSVDVEAAKNDDSHHLLPNSTAEFFYTQTQTKVKKESSLTFIHKKKTNKLFIEISI